MKKLLWVIAMCSVVALSANVFAELTAGQKMAVEAFIKQFSAPDFDTRQKAVDRLIEMGPDVVPLVRKALADTADNEVKMRCEMVLKALGDKTTAPVDRTVRDASRVTFDFKDAPLADVVEMLAELSGNKPFVVDDKIKDKTLTLAVKDAVYWEAVDKAAAALNLIYAPRWMAPPRGGNMEGRLQLVEADKDAKLSGYAGPAVVKVDSVSKLAFLRTAKAAMMMMGPASQDGLNVNLTYFWEDRLDPLTEEIELVKVQTPRGDSLLPSTPEARRKSSASMGMMMAPGFKAPPCQTAAFHLPMPAPEVRSIAEISGIVRLEFATGEREVMINDVFAAVDKEIKVDDWTITVKKVDKQNGALLVTIEAKYKGEAVALPPYWTAASYGWYVQTAEGGKRTRGFSYGGAGVGRWGGRVLVGQAEENPRPAARPAEPPKKGESTVYFQGNYEAGAASVALVLPKFHEVKEWPFTIKDVPLP